MKLLYLRCEFLIFKIDQPINTKLRTIGKVEREVVFIKHLISVTVHLHELGCYPQHTLASY